MKKTAIAALIVILGCSTSEIRKPANVQEDPISGFSDQSLETLLKQNVNGGLIYTWSPQMPYSVNAFPAILRASKKLNLPLKLLVDTNAPISDTRVLFSALEGTKVTRSQKLQLINQSEPNNSKALIDQGGYLHFPSLAVYKNEKLLPGMILGAKSVGDYLDLIEKVLNNPNLNPISEARVPVDRSQEWEVVKRWPFPKTPMYFLRPYSNGKFVPFTSTFQNYFWDIEKNQVSKLPGLVDAVPTPDRKYLTIPYAFIPFLAHLDFLEPGVNGKKAKVIFKDTEMTGAYQSVGVTDITPTSATYRVVTEGTYQKGHLRMQEYQITHRTESSAPVVKRKYENAITFCPNENLTLPMFSKTGKLFGGVDPITRQMKVFSIDREGKCQLIKNTGIISGKVDFAFDDKKYVAHVTTLNPTSVAHVVSWPSRVSMAINIIEYDWEKDEYSQLTKCEDKNCYYPSSLEDGSVLYIEQMKNGNSYNLVLMKRKSP